MDVTRDNFESALSLLRKFISSAVFVAIDLEFTGLGTEQLTPLDTPQRRYELARDVAEKYPPCQFGVSLFRPAPALPVDRNYNDRVAKWESMPFNFNLCLRPIFKDSKKRIAIKDPEFSVQSSCATFLFENGFSFDKMFADGISWIRGDEEHYIRKQLRIHAERPQARADSMALNSEDENIISECRNRIAFWISQNATLKHQDTTMSNSSASVGNAPSVLGNQGTARNRHLLDKSGSPVLILERPRTTKCQRALYDLIASEFPSVAVSTFSGPYNGTQLRLVLMSSVEEARKKNQATRDYESRRSYEQRIKESIGFKSVIDVLVDAKKPVVAHNCLHDLCKVYGNFVGPLPAELPDFKRRFSSLFPLVVDTKIMVNAVASERKWLSDILQASFDRGRNALEGLTRRIDDACARNKLPSVGVRMYENPDDEEDEMNWTFKAYQGVNAEKCRHEAGYDAFVTGHLFIQLVGILQGKEFIAHELQRTLIGDDSINMLLNRIFLSSCGGYSSIALHVEGPEDESNAYRDRDDVLVVTGFDANSCEQRTAASHRDNRFTNRTEMYEFAASAVKGTCFVVDCSKSIPIDCDRFLMVLATSGDEMTEENVNATFHEEPQNAVNPSDSPQLSRKRPFSSSEQPLMRGKNRGDSYLQGISLVHARVRTRGLTATRYWEVVTRDAKKRICCRPSATALEHGPFIDIS